MKNDPMKLMSKIFVAFSTIYGERFLTKSAKDPDFAKAWMTSMAFALRGIHPLDIKLAIQHCVKNVKWPPSIPEFLEICEQKMGIPTFDQAFDLFIKKDYRDSIVNWIKDKMSTHYIGQCSEEDLRKKFRTYYLDAIDIVRKEHEEIGLIGNEEDYAQLSCQSNILSTGTYQ